MKIIKLLISLLAWCLIIGTIVVNIGFAGACFSLLYCNQYYPLYAFLWIALNLFLYYFGLFLLYISNK